MARVPEGAPLTERGGRMRGLLDLAAGRYPAFLFGFPVGAVLPVFHFHQETRATLEPLLAYLKENGYRTVGLDAVDALVRRGVHPGRDAVVLTFDDAWSSLWLAVLPLLAEYDMQAAAYAIPARIRDAASVRPTIADDPRVDAAAADEAAEPFVTWPELRAMAASGRIDVQSHTHSHSMIFSSAVPTGVVDPAFEREAFLNRPRIWRGGRPVFLTNGRLGSPLFDRRSRMSDALEFVPDESQALALETYVAAHGGAAFFDRSDWRADLAPRLAALRGRMETPDERRAAIAAELSSAREILEAQVKQPVRHVCLPWGIGGAITSETLRAQGYATAVQNRVSGALAPRSGTDPFFIKRLHSRFIRALPGRGRRHFFALA